MTKKISGQVTEGGSAVENAVVIATLQEDVANLSQSQATAIQSVAKLTDANGNYTFEPEELFTDIQNYHVVAHKDAGNQRRGQQNYPYVEGGSEIPESVIHRYRFEGDGSDSVGSFDGSVNGGGDAFTSTNPIEGTQSFVGDGSDNRLSLPSDIDVDATRDGISFEFSVEFSSVSSGGGVFSLDDQNTTFFAFFPSDGELQFSYISSGSSPTTSVTGLQTGVLYDFILQYDSAANSTDIYVDGSLEDSGSTGAPLTFKRNNNNIGSQKGGSRYLSAARLDDFRIHDRSIK